LINFYRDVTPFEHTDPPRARTMFDRLMVEGLECYKAPADVWHNTSMVAAHVEHRDAELALIQAGLRDWPDNVDLLCDEFQLRYSTHYDTTRAAEIWAKLWGMDRKKTGPFWRFWAYGAIYHATTLYDPVTARQLLDDGVRSVTRDSLCDLLRIYRRVLIDSTPRYVLTTENDIIAYQKDALKQMEAKYQLGISLGVENAYVLATELAKLYQERAGEELIPQNASTQQAGETAPVAKKTDDGQAAFLTATEKVTPAAQHVDYLTKALEYLELAEMLYTGDSNHPVQDIYRIRARILMAQRRYGDALKLLNSLPLDDASFRIMRTLAAQMTGMNVDETKELTMEAAINKALPALLDADGELLFHIAQANPSIKEAVINVAQKLVRG
jgi:hypothetical protein